jgi:GNAT superfamily N-acetyltransferase
MMARAKAQNPFGFVGPMQIVRARREDASELTRIALAAKQHWGYPEVWIDGWRELLTIRPEIIASQEIYTAIVDGRAIGFYGLHCHSGKVQLEHLWVLPAAMNRGVGRALFTHALERARALGFQSLEIESDPNAAGFYERMGARRVGVNVTELEGQRRELPLLIYEIARVV